MCAHPHVGASGQTAVGRRHHDCLRAGDHRHAVVARQRIGHQGCREVFVHGHRRAVDGIWIFCRPLALGDGDVAVVGFLQAVFPHLPRRHQRVDAVRAAVPERRQVQLRDDVEVRRHLGVAAKAGGVAADHQHDRGGAGLDRAHRMPEHVHGRGAAIGVLHQPAQLEAELPGEVDRGVGRQRERRRREAVHLARAQVGVLERRHRGVANEGVRGLSRLGTTRVDRLTDADDGGVHDGTLSLRDDRKTALSILNLHYLPAAR